MTDRREYFKKRYYNEKRRQNELNTKKKRYSTDDAFRRRSRERDKERYNHRKSWGGLLDIHHDLFLKINVCEII